MQQIVSAILQDTRWLLAISQSTGHSLYTAVVAPLQYGQQRVGPGAGAAHQL